MLDHNHSFNVCNFQFGGEAETSLLSTMYPGPPIASSSTSGPLILLRLPIRMEKIWDFPNISCVLLVV